MPPFPFKIHRIEHLVGHLSFLETTALLNQAVCECRFPVINMGDDREIANAVYMAAHGRTITG